ncbi:MAG TPA: immunoglobulin domain-containing protein, partial [Candidatus Angelobacter sp.]
MIVRNLLHKILSGMTLYPAGVGSFAKKFARVLCYIPGLIFTAILFSNSASAQIKVTSTLPNTMIVPAGTEVTFTVFASEGTQTLTYTWQYSSDGVNFAPLPNANGISGIHNPTLVIASAQTTNDGQYRCMVSDAGTNSATSKPATLTVTVPLPQPISQDPSNNRYFNLGGQTLALLGVSGEYLPHVDTDGRSFPCGANCTTSPSLLVSSAYCTYDTVPSDTSSTIKAHRCIDQLALSHLSLMRLWISLNSSPGTDKTGSNPMAPFPYPHEQPFPCTLGAAPQWNLNSFDDVASQNSYQCDDLISDRSGDTTFFTNLKELVGYAQSKGVIVEITLFDPWNGTSSFGPYQSNQNPVVGSFTNPLLFVESQNYTYPSPPSCTPKPSPLDSQPLRPIQVNLLIQVVNALYYYDNIYYELANEADFQVGLTEQNVTAWHKYMADTITSTESGRGARRHLIAANYTGQAAIDATVGASGYSAPTPCPDGSLETASGRVSILNGHYIKVQKTFSSPTVSALDLVQNYNTYTNAVQIPQNRMIWGFNETKLTGYPPPSPSKQFFNVVSSMRAEASEFLLKGGGLYDLYAFDWGNSTTNPSCQSDGQTPNPNSPNHCNTTRAIGYLGKLSDLLGGRAMGDDGALLIANLRSMKRDSTAAWVGGAPAQGDPNVHWAALQNSQNRWLLYLHHSTVSTDSFAQYQPLEKTGCTQNADNTYSEDNASGGCYHTTYQISNLLGCRSGV